MTVISLEHAGPDDESVVSGVTIDGHHHPFNDSSPSPAIKAMYREIRRLEAKLAAQASRSYKEAQRIAGEMTKAMWEGLEDAYAGKASASWSQAGGLRYTHTESVSRPILRSLLLAGLVHRGSLTGQANGFHLPEGTMPLTPTDLSHRVVLAGQRIEGSRITKIMRDTAVAALDGRTAI